LDICRTAQQNSGGGSNQLKPPLALPQLQYDQQQSQQLETKLLNKSVVDKETNTSRENLTCCRISDKCDNHNSCSKRNERKKKKGRSKCCEVGITCSTNSINFDNLQLQCMCSSDNNSEEDDDEDEGGGCSHHHPGNFRERLLMFSGASKQDDSHLRKRASELVLGTNFDTPIVYKNNQSHRISKTFDSCDNIYKPSSKSNHSLSTESDQKSIPYTYLERPTMKLSQSEDKNLRELKIALSTNLPSANMPPSSSMRTQQQPTTQIITAQHHQASTSTSSTTSSKIDKISFSLSTSSTSDALIKRQNCGNNKACENAALDAEVQQHELGIDNQSDRKCEEDFDDNKMITTTVACDNNNKTTVSTVNNNNNNNVSNGDGGSGVGGSSNSNGSSRKRKGAEGKLAIDLNDRSKYTEEVSV
jgi:hypothetical protein